MGPEAERILLELITALIRSAEIEDHRKAKELVEWLKAPEEATFRDACAHLLYEVAWVTEQDPGGDTDVTALYDRAMAYAGEATRSVLIGGNHRAGLCLERKGLYAEALERYREALKNEDAWPAVGAETRWLLSGLLENAEHPDEALTVLDELDERVLPTWVKRSEVVLRKARCCLRARRHNEGLEVLDRGEADLKSSGMASRLLLESDLAQGAGLWNRALGSLEALLANEDTGMELRLAAETRLSMLRRLLSKK